MKNKLIFIAGMPGSGKSLASDELVEKGFGYVRFGQIVLDRIKKEGLEINVENEKKIREKIREESGVNAMAILSIPKIDELLKKGDVVVDGIYGWSHYKVLKEKYSDIMSIIAVYASPETRYERLENRTAKNDHNNRFRSSTKEQSRSRDYAEIESMEKAGPIAMADYTIINTGTLEELKKELNRILSEIDDQD